MAENSIETATAQILASRKYRDLDIPQETINDLFTQEINSGNNLKQATKEVRAKLHNIIAPYLDTLDYPKEIEKLESYSKNGAKGNLVDECTSILRAHDSTRERLPYCQEFFAFLFNQIGAEGTILDLACGLNPFFLPLVTPPENLDFKAYDIHGPRVVLINKLFHATEINGKAFLEDILVYPPLEKAKAAFIFKEIHRMEKREKGVSRRLIEALQAEMIFISLPTRSLYGKYDLRTRMQRLVENSITGIAGLEMIKEFPSETVYQIRKHDG